MSYQDLVHVREDTVDGIGPWTWIKSDIGAWDGPKSDWETSHKHEYFRNVKKFNVVLQAGGNQGMYPRLLAEKFKAVYTFEPDPLNFFCLTQNCQIDTIVKIQAALGNNNSLLKIARSAMSNTGMHRMEPNGFITQIQIDNIDFPELDLILLDVEGYEANILDGAIATLRRHKPVVVCENGSEHIGERLAPIGYVLQGWSKSDAIYYVP